MTRNHHHTFRIGTFFGAALLLGTAIPAQAFDLPRAQSVEEFMNNQDRWASWASSNKRLTVEGRYTSLGPHLLNFIKCPVPFVPPPDDRIDAKATPAHTVEASGLLKRVNGDFVFVVFTSKAIPSDMQRVEAELRKIDRTDPEAFYEVARVTRARGKFYSDKQLLAKAGAIVIDGLRVERAALGKNDAAGLLAFARKVHEQNLSDALRDSLIHEAYHIMWQSFQESGKPPLDEIIAGVEQSLDGSTTPIDPAQLTLALPASDPEQALQPVTFEELQNRYAEAPLEVYNVAPPEVRRTIHRLFRNNIVQHKIESQAAADGSNGSEIADQFAKAIPDRPELVRNWRIRNLEFRYTQLPESEPAEVLALAEEFARVGLEDRSQEIRQSWFDEREKEWRSQGAPGLIRAADYALRIVRNKPKAVELLIEAYKLRPNEQAIANKLTDLGYRLEEGEWITSAEFVNRPLTDREQAIKNGTVLPGMTADEVRRSLGRPVTVIRAISGTGITEVWDYREEGLSGLAVHFKRRRAQDADQAEVIRVQQLTSQ